jgi:hypothetical protein
VLHESGRTDEATALRQRTLPRLVRALGPRSGPVLDLKQQVALAAFDDDRTDEAIALDRELVDQFERARPPKPIEQAYELNNLGWDLIERDADESLQFLEKARALFERSMGADAFALSEPLTGSGLALLRLGRAVDARAPLERALRLRDTPQLRESVERAETELVLARALGGGERALALARHGREVLVAHPLGRRRARLVAEADAWLAAHGPR